MRSKEWLKTFTILIAAASLNFACTAEIRGGSEDNLEKRTVSKGLALTEDARFPALNTHDFYDSVGTAANEQTVYFTHDASVAQAFFVNRISVWGCAGAGARLFWEELDAGGGVISTRELVEGSGLATVQGGKYRVVVRATGLTGCSLFRVSFALTQIQAPTTGKIIKRADLAFGQELSVYIDSSDKGEPLMADYYYQPNVDRSVNLSWITTTHSGCTTPKDPSMEWLELDGNGQVIGRQAFGYGRPGYARAGRSYVLRLVFLGLGGCDFVSSSLQLGHYAADRSSDSRG
jgi:hypothetical protein